MQQQLFVDLGMSGTKALMSSGSKLQSYLCPSRVADLPPSELQILTAQGAQLGGGLESGAYLQIGKSAYALAEDAEGRSNKTTMMLRKSALAHLRILGVIGEMAHRYNRSSLSIDLGISLPFDEYLSDQQEVSQSLAAARTFIYRGKKVEFAPRTIKILPEGAGLVQWRKIQAAKRAEPTQTYIVVMVGYRDLTFLVFQQGKPPTGEPSGTVKLGYLEYLQSIAQGMCRPDHPFLIHALLKNSKTVAFPDQPGKQFPLSERMGKADAYYWEQVRHHLSDKFAALGIPSYEVLVGGGTALSLLRPHLEKYLSVLPGATVNWLPELSKEFAQAISKTSESDQARFADCFGGAKWLASKFSVEAGVA